MLSLEKLVSQGTGLGVCVRVYVFVFVLKCLTTSNSRAGHRSLADKDSGVRMVHGTEF